MSACGIPANTLRTWERRYGFPSPRRGDGGHRLYDTSDIERLRLIADALARGLRAGQVVPASPDELRGLIGSPTRESDPADWLEIVARLDGPGFDRALRLALAEQGLADFVSGAIAPFLRELGAAWADGRIDVHQEHFASHRVRACLEGVWRPLAGGPGRPVVLATLPGEQHDLGLQMVAAVLVTEGVPLVFLGADLPLSSIRKSVEETRPRALVLSATEHTGERASGQLAALLPTLPPGTEVLFGGRGAQPLEGVRLLGGLQELRRWARAPAQGVSTPS
ncbi:MAG: cobalamin B12-binding domain-containing protein [Proteobacteria bacterium]|nr:cobalamin B12-binding domain-containing protein [Pseudomonadota bacterium]MCP4917817.1 cobalamin B12-binding domain-containing protein [Pseudomonadota bacterium]